MTKIEVKYAGYDKGWDIFRDGTYVQSSMDKSSCIWHALRISKSYKESNLIVQNENGAIERSMKFFNGELYG